MLFIGFSILYVKTKNVRFNSDIRIKDSLPDRAKHLRVERRRCKSISHGLTLLLCISLTVCLPRKEILLLLYLNRYHYRHL